MANDIFSGNKIGTIELPRLLTGYYSIRDLGNRMKYDKAQTERELAAFLLGGINGVIGAFTADPARFEQLKQAEEAAGHNFIRLDLMNLAVGDGAAQYRAAEKKIAKAASEGVRICILDTMTTEKMVNKHKRTIEGVETYLTMIRSAGMGTGLQANMPEIITYGNDNGYDVDVYVQNYNCAGYLMQVEIEQCIQVIHDSGKPVIVLDPVAGGKVTPYVGLTFVWNCIREQDFVAFESLYGFTAEEIMEISNAALEHRLPWCIGRDTPSKNKDIFKK